MYITRKKGSCTSGAGEERNTLEVRKLDLEENASRSSCYGLTWSPSRDSRISTDNPSTFRSSPSRTLNNILINEKRNEGKFDLTNDLSRPELDELSTINRERHLDKLERSSSGWRTPAGVSSRTNLNYLDSFECWLSGEKFFRTPPKDYDRKSDTFIIPTRDKSNNEDCGDGDNEGTRHNGKLEDYFELSYPRTMSYDNKSKTLLDSPEDLKPTNETNKEIEAIDDRSPRLPFEDLRRSSSVSSGSGKEVNAIKKYLQDFQSSRSTIANSSSSNLNILENVEPNPTPAIHNHIYLSSKYLDRYFNVPLTKYAKLARRNARVSRIHRRILKRPKRARSRLLVGSSYRNNSFKFEVENVNNNRRNANPGKAGNLSKTDVCDLLAEIDEELTGNLQTVEHLREKLPSCIAIDTASTPEIKRTLSEVTRRCRDCIRNSEDRGEITNRMNDLLSRTVIELREVVRREKQALQQEEQCYARLQFEPIQGRQDFQKIKRLKNDAEWNSFNRKALIKKLLCDISLLIKEVCLIEDNKENIKKQSTNRKSNDHEPGRTKSSSNKTEGKSNRIKSTATNCVRKDSQLETQMSFLSKTRPNVGKNKTVKGDLDGNKDRLPKDKVLKENEERAEKQTLDKAKRSVYTVSSNFGSHANIEQRVENPKVIKDKKDNVMTLPINVDGVNDRSKQPVVRRKRQVVYNAPQPVWKPGGAVKSLASNSTTILHVEPTNRRAWQVLCDKENSELSKSIPVKRVNQPESASSKKNVLKETRKNEHFREERVTKLCNLLAEVKMQKGTKEASNLLSQSRSSMTPADLSSNNSFPKNRINSNDTKLSLEPKPRPGIARSTSKTRNLPNVVQHDTKSLYEDKSEILTSKYDSIDTCENIESTSSISMKFVEDNARGEDLKRDKKNSMELANTSDQTDSSILLTEVADKRMSLPSKLTNVQSFATIVESKPANTDLLSRNVKKNAGDNVEREIRRLERHPSFLSFTNVGCHAEFNSTSNSDTMVVASSKCCQISLSSLSSARTCSNYDRLYAKKQSPIEITPPMEKDSLDDSTDDDRGMNFKNETKDRDDLIQDYIRKRESRRKESLNSLKEYLHDRGIDTSFIEKAEDDYKKDRDDRRTSIRKSISKASNFDESNISAKTSFIEIPIDREIDEDSTDIREFPLDKDIRIRSSDRSIDPGTEKIDDSTKVVRKISKSSQTSDLREFCDAYTNAEDVKSECSTYVDVATVSCYEMSLRDSTKDVFTEICPQDESILSSRRMIQTQTNPLAFSSMKSVFTDETLLKLDQNEEKGRNRSKDRIHKSTSVQVNRPERTVASNTDLEESAKLQLNNFCQTSLLSKSSSCLTEDLNVQRQSVEIQTKEPSNDTPNLETSEDTFLKPSKNDVYVNGVSVNVLNALQTAVLYTRNIYKAIQIYRKYKNIERLKKCDKISTTTTDSFSVKVASSIEGSKSSESLAGIYMECITPENYTNEEHIEIIKPKDVSNESTGSDSSESEESESYIIAGFKDLNTEETRSCSKRSSFSSISLEVNETTEKKSSLVKLKNRRSKIMKYPEEISLEEDKQLEEESESLDSHEFVLTTEAMLLLTYLTVCAFVFCCLKFSMTCESFIL